MHSPCTYTALDLSLTLCMKCVDNGNILHYQSVVEIYELREPRAETYCAANVTLFSPKRIAEVFVFPVVSSRGIRDEECYPLVFSNFSLVHQTAF